jgi:ParB family chromosome partitioning protein
MKKKELGRGISALLGDIDEYSNDRIHSTNVNELNINDIVACATQPRKHFDENELQSLENSIKEKGILQPILVRTKHSGHYEIIAGERRFRAAQRLGLQTIPAIIRECSDQEALELAIIENIQRDDLNPIEEADAYNHLIKEFKYTQEELAQTLSKSRSYVANILRLLTLPDHIKKLVQNKKITAGHAKVLINSDKIDDLVEQIVKNNLSVRDTEDLVKQSKQNPLIPTQYSEIRDQETYLSNELSTVLGYKTQVKINRYGGNIALHFHSFEEMDAIMDKLKSAFLTQRGSTFSDQILSEI